MVTELYRYLLVDERGTIRRHILKCTSRDALLKKEKKVKIILQGVNESEIRKPET